MYLAIRSEEDAHTLQKDLDQLAKWEQRWKMEFHPDKCQVLSITRNKEVIHHDYTLHGHVLEHVTAAKYLGVTITQDLRWNQHISNITAKANRTLGFLRRNLQISNPELRSRAYKALVRPQIEYATTVWDPHTQNNIKKLEMVQRRAARYALNRYHNRSSVTDMLCQLGWPSLQHRREHQRLAMLYKIRNGLVAVNADQYLTPATRSTRRTRGQAYIVPHTKADYLHNSFFPRTAQAWNNLPEDVTSALTLDQFKSKLSALYPTM